MKTKNTTIGSLNIKQPDYRITVRLPENLFHYVKSQQEPATEVVVDALSEKMSPRGRLDLAYIEGFFENKLIVLESGAKEQSVDINEIKSDIKEIKELLVLIVKNMQH